MFVLRTPRQICELIQQALTAFEVSLLKRVNTLSKYSLNTIGPLCVPRECNPKVRTESIVDSTLSFMESLKSGSGRKCFKLVDGTINPGTAP